MKPCGHTTVVPSCLACTVWSRFDAARPAVAEVQAVAPKHSVHTRKKTPCEHLGRPTGESKKCEVCGGNNEVAIHRCGLHGECTPDRVLVNNRKQWPWCMTCKDYSPVQAVATKPSLNWAYGLTTVPERLATTLPTTLASLKSAGFDRPRLFVDGDRETTQSWRQFGLELTFRWPRLRTHGNWFLALHELFVRNPLADRYAIFQDDLVASANLRAYLESCAYPGDGYWNLYTFPENQRLAPMVGQTGRQAVGWYRSNGKGKGAVALVFDRDATLSMLSSEHMAGRPMNLDRGWRAVDGGVVDSMRKAKRYEYVHNPSLVQHTGERSSMGNNDRRGFSVHPKAESFRGEDFDAMNLVKERDG